jgi:polyisoprenoid-binding protein YceI
MTTPRPWKLDLQHSSLRFSVRWLTVGKVMGSFAEFDGKIELHPEALTSSKLSLAVKTASVTTHVADRDAHLRSADFFWADKYPELTFVSREIVPVRNRLYKVHGDLTIRGITKPIVADVEHEGTVSDPWGGERAAFSVRASLNRHDFGLNWQAVIQGDASKLKEKIQAIVVGDVVEIDCSLVAMHA